jgi:uncharacterized protein (DUF1330 family)
MSDAPAYVVANFTIHNKDEYLKYEKGFFSILKKHGGSFLPMTTIPNTWKAPTPDPVAW